MTPTSEGWIERISAGITHEERWTAGEYEPQEVADDVVVCSTPELSRFLEDTVCRAVSPELPADKRLVGNRIECSHLRPTPVGEEIRVEIVVEDVDPSEGSFVSTAEAFDDYGKVGEGNLKHTVVDREQFAAFVRTRIDS